MASLWQSFMDAPDYFEESPWFPNPVICIRDLIRTGTSETIARLPWNGIGVWLSETWGWISASNYTDPRPILLPLLLAVLFTLLRIFLNWILFKVRQLLCNSQFPVCHGPLHALVPCMPWFPACHGSLFLC